MPRDNPEYILSTNATVELTVVVRGSPYGKDWEMDKIFEQCERETIEAIRNLCSASKVSGYTVNGVKVNAVIVRR